MKKLIFLSCVFLVGCDVKVIDKKYFIDETKEFCIPDSSKQAYADFVSKSVSGCEESCGLFLDQVKEEAGKIYGTRVVELKTRTYGSSENCNSPNCFDSTIERKDMTDEEFELVKNFCWQ